MNKQPGVFYYSNIPGRALPTTQAARWQRAFAAMTDLMLILLVTVPAACYLGVPAEIEQTGSIPLTMFQQLLIVNIAGFMAFHGYLLAEYGQTVGKRMMNIAIVDLNGKVPPLSKILLVRYLPMWLMGATPLLLQMLPLLDGLFILHGERRCFHDWMAGTRVVNKPVQKRK